MTTRVWVSFVLLLGVAEAAPPPYREQIPAQKTAAIRSHRLTSRDKPVAVAVKAPHFAALPTGAPVVLVFYRGHWWPWCRRQLGELQDHAAEIAKSGARIVALSADSSEDAAALAARLGLSYALLSDAKLDIAGAYGVRMKGQDIALPAVFVIDRSGTIRWEKIGEDPADRPTIDEIVRALSQTK